MVDIKTQPCIDLRGDAARNEFEDLAAKLDRQAIDDVIEQSLSAKSALPSRLDGFGHECFVFRHPSRLVEQRRVRRRVLGAMFLDRRQFTGIGHHDGVLLELLERIHPVLPFLALCVPRPCEAARFGRSDRLTTFSLSVLATRSYHAAPTTPHG
ncbi:MAG: hypothetical protein R3B96_17875 [Pirellulaceae bacterium]